MGCPGDPFRTAGVGGLGAGIAVRDGSCTDKTECRGAGHGLYQLGTQLFDGVLRRGRCRQAKQQRRHLSGTADRSRTHNRPADHRLYCGRSFP